MQSGGNSFSGDVVLDNINLAIRDEQNNLYHLYETQIYVWAFIMKILLYKQHFTKRNS